MKYSERPAKFVTAKSPPITKIIHNTSIAMIFVCPRRLKLLIKSPTQANKAEIKL